MTGKKNNQPPSSFESFDIHEYQGTKTNIHRFDYDDLFDEAKNVIEDVFRVKHSSSPKRGEKWKVFKNNEVVVELDGSKLTKKDCEFLRSLDGVRWLITHAKADIKSIKNISAIKTTLKKERQNR